MAVNKKGVFVVIFFGGILLTSTIMFALPPPAPTMSDDSMSEDAQWYIDNCESTAEAFAEKEGWTESEMEEVVEVCIDEARQLDPDAFKSMASDGTQITITGTPMDNFPDEQRATFCGVEKAKSNSFVTEYKIPTLCTQPLAIKVTPDGNVWFIETNTGSIGKFDPISEQFIEFENSFWPEQGRTMSWGMDYSPDGTLWYTDGTYDSIWKFNTITETFDGMAYPASESGSLPQKIEIDGSNVFVNDFTGGKITIFDLVQNMDDVTYMSVLNPIPEAFTGDLTIDSENNLWYTNWVVDSTGFLVKLNLEDYQNEVSIDDTETTLEKYIHVFDFPNELNTANGLTTDQNGDVWIVDTSSSFFFRFDPTTEEFTKYITTEPPLSSYGNVTGVIKSPVSRPYWIDTDNSGNLVFNEQTSNQIAILDVQKESLVEYMIPSKNPNWADCDLDSNANCGVAQIFGFDITDNAIWFTEWAENNIGVIDTTKPLPFKINTDKETLILKKGESDKITLTITYADISDSINSEIKTSHTASTTTNFSDLLISSSRNSPQGNTEEITITIQASETSLTGNYKVLLGIGNNEVTISQYVDVIIES